MHFRKDIILILSDFCIESHTGSGCPWAMTWMIILPAAISISKVTCSASSQLGQEGIADSQCFKKRLQEGVCVDIRGRWSNGIHYSSYKALQWMASGFLCHCLELCKIPQWNSSVTQSRWPPRAEGGYAQSSCATAAGQQLGPQWHNGIRGFCFLLGPNYVGWVYLWDYSIVHAQICWLQWLSSMLEWVQPS